MGFTASAILSNAVFLTLNPPATAARSEPGCDRGRDGCYQPPPAHLWIPSVSSGFRTMRACDRMRSFIRPPCAMLYMTVGRYGDAQRRLQIRSEGSKAAVREWFFRSGSFRSIISHSLRRPLHTPRAWGRGVALYALTPSPPGSDNSPASSASPRCRAPSGWLE